MLRLDRSLASVLALSTVLSAPALAQTNDPVLLVPPKATTPGSTGPAYGQEFQGTATPPSAAPVQSAPMPSMEVQEIHSPPVSQAQPYRPDSVTPASTPVQGQGTVAANAEDAADARSAIADAEATVIRLTGNSGFKKELGNLMDRAVGIMVIPSFLKAGFIVGAAYGNGLLMTRGADGTFSDPAFYRMTAGSVGFQVGMQDNEVVMVIMTQAGLKAIKEDQFKGGANVSVTFFLIGGGAEAATTTDVGEDIYAFSHSVGLFGGAGLEGTAVQPKTAWNEAIYGQGATPDAILDRSLTTPLATNLKSALGNR
jgi:lipid-binding SYLF domain-containing protein